MNLLKNREFKFIRTVRQGKICDVTYMNFRPRCNIRKISKNQYIRVRRVWRDVKVGVNADGFAIMKRQLCVESDGEVYEVKPKQPDEHGVMRNQRSLRAIFRELRYWITTNFCQENSERQLFVTLTYRENMQDPRRLHSDCKKFFQKLKRAVPEHELGYINIVEPQGRGAWHVHMLLKTLNQEQLFIPHERMEQLWGHGATRTERLSSTDHVGAYFVAYLSNASVSDAQIAEMGVEASDIVVKDGKKYLKGSRLTWYPDYMQIYRHSRNLVKPDKAQFNRKTLEELYPHITYQHVSEVDVGDGKILKIGKEQRKNRGEDDGR